MTFNKLLRKNQVDITLLIFFNFQMRRKEVQYINIIFSNNRIIHFDGMLICGGKEKIVKTIKHSSVK